MSSFVVDETKHQVRHETEAMQIVLGEKLEKETSTFKRGLQVVAPPGHLWARSVWLGCEMWALVVHSFLQSPFYLKGPEGPLSHYPML